jgi:hypothetical protein
VASFVPATERIPGVYQRVELQRQGGLPPLQRSGCLIGYRLSTATTELDGVIKAVESRSQVQRDYGAGSMMDLMVRESLASGRLALQDQERGSVPRLFTLGVEPPSGVGTAAATYTITVTGPATANGEARLYLGPNTFRVPTVNADTADEIAARIEEFLDTAAPEMGFTAATVTNVVTLTAKHIGEWGNDLVFRAETRDAPGVSVVIAAGVAGAGVVDLTGALDLTFAQDFDYIVVPQYDTATRALLSPHVTNGWDFSRKKYRVVVAAQGGNVSAAQTAAAAIDDFRVVLAHGERTATALDSARSFPFEHAAAVGARLWSQSKPNWNFNRASLSVYGRPKNIDRDALNDTINAGVCEIVEPENGSAPGALVDPITTAVTDQTGATTASDTTWQPVEYPKVTAFLLRQIQIELDRFAQLPADEETRISAIAACRSVLQAAADEGIIQAPTDESVTAEYETVGARTDLVIGLDYRIIVGLDIIAVRHNVRAAGAE